MVRTRSHALSSARKANWRVRRSLKQGRQARTKQADPLPFAGGGKAHPGAPERKGKRKLVAEAKGERAQGPRAAKRAKKVSEGGAEVKGKGKAKAGKGKGKAEQKKKVTDGVEWESDDDDIEGMKAEDGWTDEEDEMSDAEASGLEKARSCVLLLLCFTRETPG